MSRPDDFEDARAEQDELESRKSALVHTTGQTLSQVLSTAINDGKPYYFCSLKDDGHEGKRLRAKYLIESGNDIASIIEPNSFAVQNVIVAKASWTDEDGVPITTPKVVLIDESGKAKIIIAGVWCRGFVQLFNEFGPPPWNPPVVVSAREIKISGGRRYYQLVLP